MKTVNELVQEGVTRVRREPWEEHSFLELDTFDSKDGKHINPWGRIYGVQQYFEGMEPEAVLVVMEPLSDPVWEEWIDPKER